MNGNDLMDAFSAIDEKYIMEAAYELNKEQPKKTAGIVSFKRFLYIALPSAAAILLIVALSIPAIRRAGNTASESAAPAMAESAEPAVAESEEPAMADEAAPAMAESAEPEMSGSAESAMADESPALTAEIPEMSDEAPAMNESEEASSDTYAYGSESIDEDAAKTGEIQTNSSAQKGEDQGILKAVCENGTLTVYDIWDLPTYLNDRKYTISSADDETVYSSGMIKDVMTKREPLVLAIPELDLEKGKYKLVIGKDEFVFEIN